MTETPPANRRYFLAYTGVKLPLTLLNELEPNQLENRITYFCADYDGQDRLIGIQKMVYGEVEMEHRYEYDEAGILRKAEIIDIDGEVTALTLDGKGAVVA